MNEQVNVALDFFVFFASNRQGATGLTVTVDIRRLDGTLIVTAGTVIEVGGGIYRYHLDASLNTQEDILTAVFKTSDVTVDQAHVPSIVTVGKGGIEKLELITAGGTVVVAASVTASGEIHIHQGSDYFAADNKQLDFSDTTGTWPDLSGATVVMYLGTVAVSGSITQATGNPKTVRFQPTASQTEVLTPGSITFSIIATLGSGHKVILVEGTGTVVKK